MNCFSMMSGDGVMMWVMGSFALLTAVALLLGSAALIKYLFVCGKQGPKDDRLTSR
ncbi:hypothetical protein QN379_03380 [Glaciimonas sp. Gout2]|nr:hypothetical protein [Glaciimonas sp. Gout2]